MGLLGFGSFFASLASSDGNTGGTQSPNVGNGGSHAPSAAAINKTAPPILRTLSSMFALRLSLPTVWLPKPWCWVWQKGGERGQLRATDLLQLAGADETAIMRTEALVGGGPWNIAIGWQ